MQRLAPWHGRRAVACRLAGVTAGVLLALTAGSIASASPPSGPLAAQENAVVLQRSLDKKVDLAVTDAPIKDVFARLTAQTGVKFVISEETLSLLPYGDQTQMSVTLKNVTLRKALSPMLAQAALQWMVEDGAVEILPKEGLYRLCRSADFDEYRILGLLYSTSLQPAAAGGPALAQLQKITGNKSLKLVFPQEADQKSVLDRANKSMPCMASDWLDFLCQGQGWTWFLRGDEIAIIENRAQVERQLQKRVSLNSQNAPLMTALLDLANKARVKLVMDPGVMEYLPADVRDSLNLQMSDATVAQALEVISGATGLRFIVTGDGVKVEASESLKRKKDQAASQPTRRRAPFFVKMTMPGPGGTEIEVFLNPDELPEDLVDSIQAQKVRFVDKMLLSLPKTQPASRPASREPAIEGGTN